MTGTSHTVFPKSHMMLWQDIRVKHPTKWLVIEAKKYRQADDIFIVEEVEVLDVFDQSFGVYDEFR